MKARCPTCLSPAPHLHPAVQFEGEVNLCPDVYHLTLTPSNTIQRISAVKEIAERISHDRQAD
jgi:hypothetical protein